VMKNLKKNLKKKLIKNLNEYCKILIFFYI